jgi:acylphosphatase
MAARHLHISGFVQGVAYREAMRHEAERLGITGWVRNRLDGSVEAVIEGDETALAAMLEWARRGPPAARVSNVDARECEGGYARFERRPTA